MPKFRKKPVVIEARQFETNNDDGTCLDELVKWIVDNGGEARHDDTDIYIETLEGTMRAGCGAYIIQGVEGEFYACAESIFEKTYDPVDD